MSGCHSSCLVSLCQLVVFRYHFADEKDKPICAPLLKSKASKSSDQSPAADLNAIENNIEKGKYESVAQFDADMNAVFTAVMREQGRLSTLGNVAVHLKKVKSLKSYKS